MSNHFLKILSSCLLIAGAGPAFAQSSGDAMPSGYLDEVHAKLLHAGYSSVRVIHADTFKLSAYDKYGSEVIMLMHPTNRSIMDMAYVHVADEW